jgi:hypothetical protein
MTKEYLINDSDNKFYNDFIEYLENNKQKCNFEFNKNLRCKNEEQFFVVFKPNYDIFNQIIDYLNKNMSDKIINNIFFNYLNIGRDDNGCSNVWLKFSVRYNDREVIKE